jgi:hypothetical protein
MKHRNKTKDTHHRDNSVSCAVGTAKTLLLGTPTDVKSGFPSVGKLQILLVSQQI